MKNPKNRIAPMDTVTGKTGATKAPTKAPPTKTLKGKPKGTVMYFPGPDSSGNPKTSRAGNPKQGK